MKGLTVYSMAFVLISFTTACDEQEVLMKGLDKMIESLRWLKPYSNDNRKPSCKFADGSTQQYPTTGDWEGTSYPDCNLSVQFHIYRKRYADATLIKAVNQEATKSAMGKFRRTLMQLRLERCPLFIVTHGYLGATIPEWGYQIKDALLDLGYNVVLVEWFSAWKRYLAAVADTRLVSDMLAAFINGLIAENFVSIEQIILVGFSLGAHISGMTAEKVKGIKAVIGLDPAGPFFDCHPNLGLTPDKAGFVQVLHTDFHDGILGWGTSRILGHIDYFLNPSQIFQPGCYFPTQQEYGHFSCSHDRAPRFFTKIIERNKRMECTRLLAATLDCGIMNHLTTVNGRKADDKSICKPKAKRLCNEGKPNCDSKVDVQVFDFWPLLRFTLENTQPEKLGRIDVETTSSGDFCGVEALVTIKFASKQSKLQLELWLIHVDEYFLGPFFGTTDYSADIMSLKLLLPLDTELSNIDVITDESIKQVSNIEINIVLQSAVISNIEYSADIGGVINVKDKRWRFSLKSKPREELKK